MKNNDAEAQPQITINLNFAPLSVTTTETIHPDGSKTVTTTTTDSPVLLTVEEAAVVLAISVRTLQLLTDLGRIPVRYVGGSPRYAVAELAAAVLELPRVPEPKALRTLVTEAKARAMRDAA
ncbi:hypothetical protein GCM10022288_11630 [Gryllotalpicola kribbensis]|uniref:Helix-turn-helix domain-containing protein n=1 Tax=Gryllotalpicola kribbensis TaxID=993084 RepID=A0ABP8ANX4_9MICO